MSIPGFVHKVTHLGVTPGSSPSDDRYTILTNTVSAVGVLVSLIYLPVNLSVENLLAAQIVPPLVSAPAFALPLWLNHRGRYWAATTTMIVIGIGTQLVFTVGYGTVSGNQFYFLPILAGVPLLYPPRYRGTGGFLLLLTLFTFIALVLWGDRLRPFLPFNDDVARGYYVLGLIMSGALVAFVSYYAHRRTIIAETAVEKRSRELVRAFRELQATQAQMIEAENQAVLGRLVAGLLHEINTPLGSIRSVAHTMAGALMRVEHLVAQHADPNQADGGAALRAMEVSPQLRDSLEASTERIASVVEGLRQFVGLDEAERKRLDVRKGIDGALLLLGPSIQGRIELVREYADAVPEVVCYPAKLNRAFLSVLQNAVQAIPDRGVVRVTVREHQGGVMIEIIDDGRGISASKMSEIFELGLTRKKGRIALRLGLPMSKRFIEELGGELAVESIEGTGTTVRMTLPVDALTRGR